jgi:hypothetical protein
MKAIRDTHSFFQKENLKIKVVSLFTPHSAIRTCLCCIKISENAKNLRHAACQVGSVSQNGFGMETMTKCGRNYWSRYVFFVDLLQSKDLQSHITFLLVLIF